RNPVLSEYAEKVNYYRTVYYLGASLYGNGKPVPAQGFWTFLAGTPQAGEWRVRAVAQLRSPSIERIVEMP
ncbi:MAG: hypothetical protein LBH97_00970, partial [Treponema sp.]|nr:hypothetical protein [Treponema sp.]